MFKRNTNAMIGKRKQTSKDKKDSVKKALQTLKNSDMVITKAEICKIAGVSKTFLYSYPEELLKPINAAIEEYNAKKRYLAVESPKMAADKSKDYVIGSQMKKLEKQAQQIEELKSKLKEKEEEIAILYGKLAENI